MSQTTILFNIFDVISVHNKYYYYYKCNQIMNVYIIIIKYIFTTWRFLHLEHTSALWQNTIHVLCTMKYCIIITVLLYYHYCIIIDVLLYYKVVLYNTFALYLSGECHPNSNDCQQHKEEGHKGIRKSIFLFDKMIGLTNCL